VVVGGSEGRANRGGSSQNRKIAAANQARADLGRLTINIDIAAFRFALHGDRYGERSGTVPQAFKLTVGKELANAA
jgi:hypothetical protein